MKRSKLKKFEKVFMEAVVEYEEAHRQGLRAFALIIKELRNGENNAKTSN